MCATLCGFGAFPSQFSPEKFLRRLFRISELGKKSRNAIESKIVIRIHVTPLDLAGRSADRGSYLVPIRNRLRRHWLSKNDLLPATAGGKGKRHQSLCLTKHVLSD